jgi:hypothetical protein
MPATKDDLKALTGLWPLSLVNAMPITHIAAHCQITAAALGLPALAANATVAERRAQIQECLGAI